MRVATVSSSSTGTELHVAAPASPASTLASLTTSAPASLPASAPASIAPTSVGPASLPASVTVAIGSSPHPPSATATAASPRPRLAHRSIIARVSSPRRRATRAAAADHPRRGADVEPPTHRPRAMLPATS
ncbi:MAG: hypothetical protein R3A52_19110 [Polyangiales bacterium]